MSRRLRDDLPTLTDGVVVLRPLRLQDADDVTECCQDSDTQRFTRIPVPYRRDDAVAWLTASSPPVLDPRTNPTWAVTVPGVTGDRWGGSINLELDADRTAQIGYMVAPWLRGRGSATRALRLACRWGLESLDVPSIQWFAHVGNTASRRVAEKVGFHVDPEPRLGVVVRSVETDYWSGTLTAAQMR